MAMMSGGESRSKDDQEQKYHLDISNIQRYPKLQIFHPGILDEEILSYSKDLFKEFVKTVA